MKTTPPPPQTDLSSKFLRILCTAMLGASLIALTPPSPQSQAGVTMQAPQPTSSGYAEAAEGLRVHYEIYGKGNPIVVLAGGFGDANSMQQVIGPLSKERQVIAIDLEGHGRTALR